MTAKPTRQITDPSQDRPGEPWKILASVRCSSENAAECRRILLETKLPAGCGLMVAWMGRVRAKRLSHGFFYYIRKYGT